MVQGLGSTLRAVWAGHNFTGGFPARGVHTLAFDMAAAETMALRPVRLYHGCPPKERKRCDHGVFIHDAGVMVRQ